ncbi:MAG TPA: hypothetical protein VGX51_04660, partial [Solirubrobacteraceae bacterium]|nr:hypothetical protein [Solirubrobacteraceae bacterium]
MNEERVQRPVARYGRYVGLLALFILALITLNTILTKPNGSKGIEPGHSVPPFAVPLVSGNLSGDADIATYAHEGRRGNVPACQERGVEILNICQLYERGPVVLALFLDAGSCEKVLGDIQSISPSFPGVQFAAVALKGDRPKLRRLVSSRGLRIPVGEDRDGSLLGLYKMASCPQVSFVYPGGVVQSSALLVRPPIATLRSRVAQLVAASRARGW